MSLLIRRWLKRWGVLRYRSGELVRVYPQTDWWPYVRTPAPTAGELWAVEAQADSFLGRTTVSCVCVERFHALNPRRTPGQDPRSIQIRATFAPTELVLVPHSTS